MSRIYGLYPHEDSLSRGAGFILLVHKIAHSKNPNCFHLLNRLLTVADVELAVDAEKTEGEKLRG